MRAKMNHMKVCCSNGVHQLWNSCHSLSRWLIKNTLSPGENRTPCFLTTPLSISTVHRTMKLSPWGRATQPLRSAAPQLRCMCGAEFPCKSWLSRFHAWTTGVWACTISSSAIATVTGNRRGAHIHKYPQSPLEHCEHAIRGAAEWLVTREPRSVLK